MMRRLVLLLMPLTAPLGAQVPFDTALVRTTTAGDLLDAARAGDALARVSSWNAAPHTRLIDDAIAALMMPRNAWSFARRDFSIAQSTEKLRRFERKYGPGSPRLNAAEVLLNYGAQWLPGFTPSADGWPSRHEVVASYVPTYLTVTGGNARAVTVAELGIRSYIWTDRWGG